MEAQVTSCDDFCPYVASSHQLTPKELAYFIIASNQPLDEYNRVSFLHAICCYDKSMDSVMFSIYIASQVYGSKSIVFGGGVSPTQLSACMND